MESVIVAGIAAIPATIAATAAWHQSRSANKTVQGNGKGPVDKMLERVLTNLEAQDSKLVKIEGWVANHRLEHLDRNK